MSVVNVLKLIEEIRAERPTATDVKIVKAVMKRQVEVGREVVEAALEGLRWGEMKRDIEQANRVAAVVVDVKPGRAYSASEVVDLIGRVVAPEDTAPTIAIVNLKDDASYSGVQVKEIVKALEKNRVHVGEVAGKCASCIHLLSLPAEPVRCALDPDVSEDTPECTTWMERPAA